MEGRKVRDKVMEDEGIKDEGEVVMIGGEGSGNGRGEKRGDGSMY